MPLSHSVIICTRNRLHDILKALTSLAAQTLQPQEILIIDSSDTALTTDTQFTALFSEHHFPHSVCRYYHTTPGLPHQRNVGAQHATGKIIHFIDDDVILEPAYLEKLDAAYRALPQCIGGMGTITNIGTRGSRLFRAFRAFFLLPRDYASGNFTWSGMPTFAYGTTQRKLVQVVGGCCMTFKRDIFLRELADPNLHGYAYMEDADIAVRMHRHGPLFYEPAARLAHYNSPTARDKEYAVRAMLVRNYTYLFFKNWFRRAPWRVVAYIWSLVGLVCEALLLRKWHWIGAYWHGLRTPLKKKLNMHPSILNSKGISLRTNGERDGSIKVNNTDSIKIRKKRPEDKYLPPRSS